MFQFRDGGNAEVYSVYSHYDCYPEGAAEQLRRALEKAWPLPRFEADEFAAAFVSVVILNLNLISHIVFDRLDPRS